MIAAIHVGFILFDCLSFWRFLLSLLVLALHFRFHLNLPQVFFIPSVVNLVAVLFNHFMWLSYFYRNYHPVWEIASFYFFIVWSVPLFIVINYSTTEVLPSFCKLNYVALLFNFLSIIISRLKFLQFSETKVLGLIVT